MSLSFLTTEEKTLFENNYRNITIIWFCIMASVILYILIVEKILGTPNQHTFHEPILRYIFLGSALFVAILIRLLRHLILKRLDKQSFTNLINRLKASSIITLSLCEMVAILGLIEYLFTRNKIDFYLMSFLSVVFFIVHFPQRSHWEIYINSHIREFQK